WQAPHRLEQAHFRHRGFHRHRIGFDEVYFHQRLITPVNRACPAKVTLQREPRQLRHFRRNFVGHDRNDSTSAKRDERERDRIVAGNHDEVFGHGVENRCHLRDIARGLLDTDDVLDLRQPLHRGRLEVHARASLHAVENDRQRYGLRDRAIVLEKALLRRLVVIRCDRENSIGAKLRQFVRQRDHFGGVIAARARKNWHLPVSQLNRNLHDAQLFFVRQRRTLTSRSARNEKLYSRINLPSHQSAQRGFVERAVRSKWRDKCSSGPSKHGLLLLAFLSNFRNTKL